MTQDIVAAGASSACKGVVDVLVCQVLVLVLVVGSLVSYMIENAAGFGKRSLGVSQRRFFYAIVGLYNLFTCIGIKLLGISKVLLLAGLLIELGGNQRCRRLGAGIGAAAGICVQRPPVSASSLARLMI